MEIFDRRTAHRSDLNVEANVSEDRQQWVRVHVLDISCGGLRFMADREFIIGDNLWFDLYVTSAKRNLTLKVRGEILDELGGQDVMHIYRVEFKEISNEDRINLDELVNYIHNHVEMMLCYR